jgi:hypothetical protein
VICALLGIESKTGSWSCGMQVKIDRTRESEGARERETEIVCVGESMCVFVKKKSE